MHVVIACTAHYQELGIKVACPEQSGSGVISGLVLLGSGHITLGVDRIVVAPVGDGGHGDTGLEGSVRVCQLNRGMAPATGPRSHTCQADDIRNHSRHVSDSLYHVHPHKQPHNPGQRNSKGRPNPSGS